MGERLIPDVHVPPVVLHFKVSIFKAVDFRRGKSVIEGPVVIVLDGAPDVLGMDVDGVVAGLDVKVQVEPRTPLFTRAFLHPIEIFNLKNI